MLIHLSWTLTNVYLDTVPDFVVFAGAVTAASVLILHFFSFSFIFIFILAVSILILAWSTRREGFSRKNIRRPMVCAFCAISPTGSVFR